MSDERTAREARIGGDFEAIHVTTVYGLESLARSLETKAAVLNSLLVLAKRLQAEDKAAAEHLDLPDGKASRISYEGVREGLAVAAQHVRALAKETVG